LYLLGNAVATQDSLTALKLYSYAADREHLPSLLKLGAWYELGKQEIESKTSALIPVEQNQQVSLFYHTKAAELGSAEACYLLMSVFVHGSHGQQKSYKQALFWANKGLENEKQLELVDTSLLIELRWQSGLLCMEGGFDLGDPQPSASLSHWSVSGKLGHSQSIWNSGLFYLNGFGTSQNIEKGVEMIRQAMASDERLSLPPQLQNMSSKELDMLVALSKKTPETVKVVDIDSLVKTAKLFCLSDMNPEDVRVESQLASNVSQPEMTKDKVFKKEAIETIPIVKEKNSKKVVKKNMTLITSLDKKVANTSWTTSVLPVLGVSTIVILVLGRVNKWF
jgi:hypothetical protein